MIRTMKPEDTASVIALAVAARLFPPDAADVVEQSLSDHFGAELEEGPAWVVDDEDGEVLGVAFYEPAKATDRTWYLTMIAVRPDQQGQGRGAALLAHVEDDLRVRGQRLLLVETSGLPSYDSTRAFYRKCGYEREARVRDYFEDGDDMVLFRKLLAGS